MVGIFSQDGSTDRRSETRRVLRGFHSAAIKLIGVPLYEFRLKDKSAKGASILIKNNSYMIDYLNVGQSLTIDFSSEIQSGHNGKFETEIRHITEVDKGRYKGHYLVGVQILE